jgi:CRP-like cAMP-binding protein
MQFVRALNASRALELAVRRYLTLTIGQLAQAAACSYFHSLQARLARWLLMARARSNADGFHLTHDTIAGLLGVRREGVTGAANAFQRRKLIQYSRGNIAVLDVRGLQAVSCPCLAVGQDTVSSARSRFPTN